MGTPPGGESSSAPCMAASGVTSTISPITRDSWPSDRTIPNRTPGFRRISSGYWSFSTNLCVRGVVGLVA